MFVILIQETLDEVLYENSPNSHVTDSVRYVCDVGDGYSTMIEVLVYKEFLASLLSPLLIARCVQAFIDNHP